MSMALADLNNGTSINTITVLEIKKSTSNPTELKVPLDIIDKMFVYISPLFFSSGGTYEIQGTKLAFDLAGINYEDGDGAKLNYIPSVNTNTYKIYLGTGGTAGTNLYYSYTKVYMGTSGTNVDSFNFKPWGTSNYGTFENVAGTSLGTTILIFEDKPLSENLFNVGYTNFYTLPPQSSYNGYFTEDKVKHRLDNGRLVTYFKGFNFNADIGFEQLTGTEYTDLQTIKNLKTNFRFFPNLEEKPDLSYDVIWDNDFNYSFTIPTVIGGGFNGNMHLEGLNRLGSMGDII
jgi:hypothetical protein